MKLLVTILWPLLLASATTALNYNFVPYTSSKYCLTMNGGYGGNGGPFTLELCVPGNRHQQFSPTTTDTVLTAFVSAHTPACAYMCLDGSGTAWGRVTQTKCDPGRKSQYWAQTSAPLLALALPGYFWYKNFATGQCLTDENGYLDQYTCSAPAPHQLWKIGTDAFRFGQPIQNQLLLGTTCLVVVNGSPLTGAGTRTLLCSPTAYNQHFKIVSKTTTRWTLVGNGKCLDGGSGGGSPYQWDCSATSLNQQWLAFNYPKDGGSSDYTYQMNTLSGLCLTWDPTNIAQVHHEACIEGNTNQQWATPWV